MSKRLNAEQIAILKARVREFADVRLGRKVDTPILFRRQCQYAETIIKATQNIRVRAYATGELYAFTPQMDIIVSDRTASITPVPKDVIP